MHREVTTKTGISRGGHLLLVGKPNGSDMLVHTARKAAVSPLKPVTLAEANFICDMEANVICDINSSAKLNASSDEPLGTHVTLLVKLLLLISSHQNASLVSQQDFQI